MCLWWSLGMTFRATPHRSQQRRDARSNPIHHTDWWSLISTQHSLLMTWRRNETFLLPIAQIMNSFTSSKSQMDDCILCSNVNLMIAFVLSLLELCRDSSSLNSIDFQYHLKGQFDPRHSWYSFCLPGVTLKVVTFSFFHKYQIKYRDNYSGRSSSRKLFCPISLKLLL